RALLWLKQTKITRAPFGAGIGRDGSKPSFRGKRGVSGAGAGGHWPALDTRRDLWDHMFCLRLSLIFINYSGDSWVRQFAWSIAGIESECEHTFETARPGSEFARGVRRLAARSARVPGRRAVGNQPVVNEPRAVQAARRVRRPAAGQRGQLP